MYIWDYIVYKLYKYIERFDLHTAFSAMNRWGIHNPCCTTCGLPPARWSLTRPTFHATHLRPQKAWASQWSNIPAKIRSSPSFQLCPCFNHISILGSFTSLLHCCFFSLFPGFVGCHVKVVSLTGVYLANVVVGCSQLSHMEQVEMSNLWSRWFESCAIWCSWKHKKLNPLQPTPWNPGWWQDSFIKQISSHLGRGRKWFGGCWLWKGQ